MFLSRLYPDTRNAAFRRDYADIHDLHRTVMAGFPQSDSDIPARQAHGVLWRLDEDRTGFVLYVQGHVQPDWSRLPAGYLCRAPATRSLQPVLDQLQPGRKLAFRLVANPTRDAVVGPDGTHVGRRRTAHRDPDQQLDWLVRKGARHGFVVPAGKCGSADAVPSPRPRTIGRAKRGAAPITIDPVRYDGHLIVTDTAAFVDALRTGVGRAKAYGCGLLSLAPPHIAR